MASGGGNESSSDHFEGREFSGPPPESSPAGDASWHAEGTVPGAQPPVDNTQTEQRYGHRSAAGVEAVVQTMRYVWGRMGVVRGTQALLQVNQLDGFDCQSCAWPSPDDRRHVAEFCENGAKAVSDEGTRKRVDPEFFKEHSVQDLLGRSDYWLNEQGRLTHPMILKEGSNHYEPISWEDAFALLASELNALSSPHEAAFYTSGRASNEAAYLYQLFVRMFGTNNLPDCSNMCHESSGAALKETIGIGKGTVTLNDFLQADLIFVVGQNPGTNHPRMLTSLELAKEKGARIISVNPLPEVGNFRFKNPNPQNFKNPLQAAAKFLGEGAKLSDLWLQIRINGDLALFKGLMKELLEEEQKSPGEIFDHEFIARYTAGYEDFLSALEIAPWEQILESSGLTRAQIRQAAELVLQSKNIICCWAMGLTQHKNSVATIRELVNFLLLGGNIGRPGAGLCPVRGHSNVQGDRTMGIWEKPAPLFLDKLANRYGFDPPRDHGCDTVKCIQAMHRGQIKIFLALGGNFLSATPDTELTAEALTRCRLTAHVSTKLNRAHLVTGREALILPCLGRSEIDQHPSGDQFVTVEDSMGIINPSRGRLKPASDQLLSEPTIVARLAETVLGKKSKLPWSLWGNDYNLIRDEIEQVIPGFEQYNSRIARGIFYLPNPPRDERKFPTPAGKANFTINQIEPLPVESGQYVLMTIRSHDQFNTTIYGLDDRYRGIYNGRRVIFMNAEDINTSGLTQGQPVDITSHFEGYERQANRFLVAPYPIPRGCVAAYFPEANVLIPVGSVAETSNTPTSKSVIVTVSPSLDVELVSRTLRHEAAEVVNPPLAEVALSKRT
jgi:molybdopterin-dependent oxidoreductase alpha subunit